jgi:hypothetical protein
MQGKEKPGKPGNLNQTPVIGGNPKRIRPEPSSSHSLEPTMTGTTVCSVEPSEVVVIQVLVVHSGWPEAQVGDQFSGGTVTVEA